MTSKIRPVEHRTLPDEDIVRAELEMINGMLSVEERDMEWLRLSDEYDIDTPVRRFMDKVEKGGGNYGPQYDLYRRLSDLLATRRLGGRVRRRRKRTLKRRRKPRRRRRKRKAKSRSL